MKPSNITLLDTREIIPGVWKPVTSTDAFEGMTQNLNDEGLYSLDIFGKMGSKERDKTEAYIDVKLPIFNPSYLKALGQIKSLYIGILKGSEYAVWDDRSKDFIKSNIIDGQTGYSFFVKHFFDLVVTVTDSYKRKQRVKFINMFRDKALGTKVLVIPAGLRDIQFMPNGAPSEPEFTEYYRKLMFRTRVVSIGSAADMESSLYDTVRWGLQSSFNDIDQYIFGLMGGKGGILQRRMSTRGVVGGTRNVITARKVSRNNLFEDDGVSPNSVDMGLMQALLNFSYVCIHAMTTKYLEGVFTPGSDQAKLVNTKTLEFEYTPVQSATVDKWTTATGITKLFNGFSNVNLRNKPIMISGHYLALVYDDGKEVCVLSDINELPEGKDRKLVTPMTYMELYYLSCQEAIRQQMSQQTRYPVTGLGSIFPANVNLLTTVGAKKRILIDLDGTVIGELRNYPIKGERVDYFDAMSVDPTREQALGSDHDGDALNSNSLCADDTKAQVKDLFGKREYYISGTNNFLYDPVNEPLMFVLKAATSGMRNRK